MDYAHGRALPLATSQGTSVRWMDGPETLEARSTLDGGTGVLGHGGPTWMSVVELAASLTGTEHGLLEIEGDLPVGAGLSSSTSFAVAVALALGGPRGDEELISLAWTCEQALGTPTGLLDQQAIVAARDGMAVLADFATGVRRDVRLPADLRLAVVHTGITRALTTSPYAQRRAQVEAAEAALGPLGSAAPEDLKRIDDALIARRARHVVTECARVDAAVEALERGDLVELGDLVDASHASLRDDFEVSLPEIDALADELRNQDGVLGVRLMGGGFGGCLLVVGDRALALEHDRPHWEVRPGGGARILEA